MQQHLKRWWLYEVRWTQQLRSLHQLPSNDVPDIIALAANVNLMNNEGTRSEMNVYSMLYKHIWEYEHVERWIILRSTCLIGHPLKLSLLARSSSVDDGFWVSLAVIQGLRATVDTVVVKDSVDQSHWLTFALTNNLELVYHNSRCQLRINK